MKKGMISFTRLLPKRDSVNGFQGQSAEQIGRNDVISGRFKEGHGFDMMRLREHIDGL